MGIMRAYRDELVDLAAVALGAIHACDLWRTGGGEGRNPPSALCDLRRMSTEAQAEHMRSTDAACRRQMGARNDD